MAGMGREIDDAMGLAALVGERPGIVRMAPAGDADVVGGGGTEPPAYIPPPGEASDEVALLIIVEVDVGVEGPCVSRSSPEPPSSSSESSSVIMMSRLPPSSNLERRKMRLRAFENQLLICTCVRPVAATRLLFSSSVG